jgi:hypothetical protein
MFPALMIHSAERTRTWGEQRALDVQTSELASALAQLASSVVSPLSALVRLARAVFTRPQAKQIAPSH